MTTSYHILTTSSLFQLKKTHHHPQKQRERVTENSSSNILYITKLITILWSFMDILTTSMKEHKFMTICKLQLQTQVLK